jgi:hypothetical protein
MIIAEQTIGNENDLIFQAPRGGRVNADNVRRQLTWAQSTFGHRPHDLRHTAATSWISNGLDVKTVLVGSVTRRARSRTGCTPAGSVPTLTSQQCRSSGLQSLLRRCR